jgi:tight adherence protein B
VLTVLAVCGAVLAAGLALPGPVTAKAPRPLRPDEPTTRARSRRWSTLAGPALAVPLLILADGTTLALGLILLAAAAGAGRLAGRARGRRTAARRQERVVEACELLAAELRSGQPPVLAVEHCVEAWPELAPVATAARLGADVPTALRRVAAIPGAEGLREVAAAWQVSHGSGAGLSVALGQVAVSARETQATRRVVAGELASAQATARMVAALPLVTLVMGAGIGGDPWSFLLRTPAGLGALAAGLALALLGLAWIERIAAAVTAR